MQARYKDSTGTNCACNSGDCINANSDCVLDDERMGSVPNGSGSRTADYVYALNEGELDLQGDLSFKTSHLSNPIRSEASTDSRYELLNAHIGWRSDSRDIRLWGKNLTDDCYATGHTSLSIGKRVRRC